MIEVSVENIYHFIWGSDRTHAECLINGNFKIVPISKSPVVKYLNGDKNEYLTQSHLFVVRESSIKYLLNEYDKVNEFTIMAVMYGDKFIISDGMHRSSIMYFKGNEKIKLKIVTNKTHPSDAVFEPFISDEKFIY
jgi:hypothetical protein